MTDGPFGDVAEEYGSGDTAIDSHPELPCNPDIECDQTPGQVPAEVTVEWRATLAVAAGGFLGTVVRVYLGDWASPVDGVPISIFVINVIGAWLLGVLLEGLSSTENSRAKFLRLFLGTGALGGFTTYSTLAADTAMLLREGRSVIGLLYVAGTLLTGFAAAWLGVLAVDRRRARRGRSAT